MSDRTPVEYYQLREVAEICRQSVYGDDPLEGLTVEDLRNDDTNESYKMAAAKANQQSEDIIETILNALRAGEFEAETIDPTTDTKYRILASEWQGNFWPERHVLSDTILGFSGDPLQKFEGRTPFVQKEMFKRWLQRFLLDYFITEIANGNLRPDEADRRLKALGFEELHPSPRVENFIGQVSKEIYWTLPMTVAWISNRTMRAVTEQFADFVRVTGHWSSVQVVNSAQRGLLWERSDGPSLGKLMIGEAMQSVEENDMPKPTLTVKESREDLWLKLQGGNLDALGKTRFGALEPISSYRWAGLKLGFALNGPDWVSPDGLDREDSKIFDLRFLASRVRELWAKQDSGNSHPQNVRFQTLGHPSNRPPHQLNAAMEYLKSLPASDRTAKNVSLVTGLKVATGKTVSVDTMRRAKAKLNA